MASGDYAVRALAGQISALALRMDTLEAGGRASQLGTSSIENGYLSIYDDAAVLRARVGRQDDGTFVGGVSRGNPLPPPVPQPPVLTSVLGGLRVTGQGPLGATVWPADFANCNVYAQDHAAPTPALVGTLASDDDVMILAVPGGSTWDVWLTAVNLSGRESLGSGIVSGAPGQAVSADILDGAITALELAAGAVTAAKLAAAAVTETAISDNAISTRTIIAGAIQTAQLAVDAVAAGTIAANAITARELTALAVTAGKIAANAITATEITAGAITAAKLAADLVLATRIIVGDPVGDRLELHPSVGLQGFSAGRRTLWFDAATGNLTALGSWTTGTDGERLVLLTDGTMRLYPGGGTNYSEIANYNGSIGIRGPYSTEDVPGRCGFISVTPQKTVIGYGVPGSTPLAGVDCGSTYNNLRGSFIGNRIDDSRTNPDGTQQRWMVCHTKSDGSDEPLTFVHYYKLSGGANGYEGTLNFDQGNCGIRGTAASSGALYVGRLDNSSAPIIASAFTVQSGRESKTAVRPLDRTRGDKFGGYRVVRSSRWRYKTVGDPVDDADPTGPTIPDYRQPVTVQVRVPGSPDSAPEYTTEPYLAPLPAAPPDSIFPMAEELEAVEPALVWTTEHDGQKYVDLRNVLGWLWDTVGELLSERDEGAARPAVLTVPHATAPPSPPAAGALLYEHNGTLWSVVATGQRTRLA